MAIIRYWLGALLVAMPLAAQTSEFTLSGFVTDGDNGESLPLASIVLTQAQLGAASNSSGYYAVKEVPAGTYEVVISYIGYKSWRDTLAFSDRDVRLDVALQVESVRLEEVVIQAERSEELEQATQSSFIALQVEPLQQMPAIGEADLLRSLQLLPGIQSASDISSGLYVRGGGPDQTAILLDHIPLYNPSHLFGFFSTFNADAIKDVQLYKGAYPAAYGRTLGAVLDVSNREGNRQRFSSRGGISLIASRLLAEGPVGQGSWMLAGRRTYLEPVLSAIRSRGVDIPLNYYFYDFNGKVNQRWGDDTFTVSTYWGQDDLRVDIEDENESFVDLRWGNRALTARWTRVFSPTLFGHFMAAGSSYENTLLFSFFATPFGVANSIRDWSLKGDVDYFANRNHTLTLGFLATLFEFDYSESFNQQDQSDLYQRSVLASTYVQDEWQGRADHAAATWGTGHLFQRRGSPALHAAAVPEPRPQRQNPHQGRRGDVPPVPAIDHHRSLQRRRFLGAARQQRRAGPLVPRSRRHRVEPVAALPTLSGGLLHRFGQSGGAGQRGGCR